MGRLTLNVLLSFAQFEREVIGERVRDEIAASKRKGIWVGGTVPLGYRTVNKKLEVMPEEADLVRRYSRFISSSARSARSPGPSIARRQTEAPPARQWQEQGGGALHRWSARAHAEEPASMSARSPIAARCTKASTRPSSSARSSIAFRRCSRNGASPEL